jgi:hypothetical protein
MKTKIYHSELGAPVISYIPFSWDLCPGGTQRQPPDTTISKKIKIRQKDKRKVNSLLCRETSISCLSLQMFTKPREGGCHIGFEYKPG